MTIRDDWIEAILNGDIERIKGFDLESMPDYIADSATGYGQLEILKWIRANGGEWTSWACSNAAANGHLETLKWLRVNGCKWSRFAANYAAANGHLETLKWIRVNGGPFSSNAFKWATENGHYETVKWLACNGVPISYLSYGLSDQMLDYCMRVGVGMDIDQVRLEKKLIESLPISRDINVLICDYICHKDRSASSWM